MDIHWTSTAAGLINAEVDLAKRSFNARDMGGVDPSVGKGE